MKVSEEMKNKICLLECGKKFGSPLSKQDLCGTYISGDAIKGKKHKTYGYGLLCHPSGKFMDEIKQAWTQKELEDIYTLTVDTAAKKIEDYIQKPLNQCQIDALVCVRYNFGHVPSVLLTKVKANPSDPSIYTTWVHLSDAQYKKMGAKVKGLLVRRKMEADWYTGKKS